jgi:hypothetical protein
MAFGWELYGGDGRSPPLGEVVKPDERLTWGRTVGIGAQHIIGAVRDPDRLPGALPGKRSTGRITG